MRSLVASSLLLILCVSVSSSARAMDLDTGLQLIISPAVGAAMNGKTKQLDLGLELGLCRGAAVLWGGGLVGVNYVDDRTLRVSAVLRGQIFILGAEVGPVLSHSDARTRAGIRARAFLGPFYLGGSTILEGTRIGADGSPEQIRSNTFEIGLSTWIPIMLKSDKAGLRSDSETATSLHTSGSGSSHRRTSR